ncbi:hypothetical protein BH09BAC1_BH09BAC1_11540 [soil metagenome]
MSLLSSPPFRILLLLTFFIVLIAGFSWYMATLQYRRDTAHLQFVDPNNNLWNTAKMQAKATLDTFYYLYPNYPEHSFVKFTNDGASGFQEDIWALVTGVGPGFVQIQVQPRYLTEKNRIPERELPAGKIIDWMVELPNGSIRGGYTTQALLELDIKKGRPNADSLHKNLNLFIDTLN